MSVGTMLSSFNGNISEVHTTSNPQNSIYQSPLQEENPYPIITNVHSKVVNGEEITLVDANNISAFIAGKNQNLLLIATSLNIDVKKIYKYNDMDAYDDLQEGHVYYLKAKKGKATTAMHTTIDEKNLWEVSQKYGIKLSKLAKKNRMKPDEPLARGRVLFLQKTRPKSVPPKVVDLPKQEEKETVADSSLVETKTDVPTVVAISATDSVATLDPSAKTHVVQDGESVFTISRMYNVTMLDLKEWNDIGDDLNLEEGQVLVVGKEVKTTGALTIVPSSITPDSSSVAPIQESTFEILPGNEMTNRGTETNTAADGTYTIGGAALTIGEATSENNTETVAEEVITETTSPQKYIVEPGEFYYGIARKFSVSAQDLQHWNDNKPLNPGDEIFVSNPSTSTTQTNIYKVSENANIDGSGVYSGKIHTHITKRGETVTSIAATYGITENDIYAQNKAVLKAGTQPKNGMFIQIPIEKNQVAQNSYTEAAATKPAATSNNYDAVAVEKPKEEEQLLATAVISNPEPKTEVSTTSNALTHKVQKGETLFAISREYGIYHKDLIKWNNLPSGGAINVGQILCLTAPEKSTEVASVEQVNTNTNIAPSQYHVVEKGDTLFSVSRKYSVSVGAIKELNGMTSNEIKIGQRLQVK